MNIKMYKGFLIKEYLLKRYLQNKISKWQQAHEESQHHQSSGKKPKLSYIACKLYSHFQKHVIKFYKNTEYLS